MYDGFSTNYDRFVDWPGRLAAEMPFLQRTLQAAGGQRILDAACGTGMHAIALAQQGYQVVGTDLSAGMIDQARANATTAGVAVTFEAAGFGQLNEQVGDGFDSLLCLGNSLPHLLTPADLSAALADFAACLRPGGCLLIQNRNFDRVLAHKERWMDPQAHQEGEREWLFVRFYDYGADGIVTFNVLTLQRESSGRWRQHAASTQLRPLRRKELTAALLETGFEKVTVFGDMQGAGFDEAHSPNLVVMARREGK